MSVVRIEIRRSLRSSRARAVIAGMSVAILAACAIGGTVTGVHVTAGRRDADASLARIDPSRPAFDLAAWQDTLVARGVGDAAPFVAGELAALPDAAVVRIYQPPTMVPALAERSPAATLLGTLDLVWVLTLLLPLAAIALGYDAISRDRERGTLAMLIVPSRNPARLVVARVACLFAVLAAATLPATVAGGLIAGVGPTAVAMTAGVLLGWSLLLASSVVLVSTVARRSATALSVLLGGWLLVAVAIPLAINGLARLAYPAPDPRAELEGEQAAADVFARPSDAVVQAEVKKTPALDPDLGADAATSQARYDLLLSRERHRRAAGARYAAERAMARRVELAEIGSWLSPASILSAALSDLAGGGPSEQLAFAKAAADYRDELDRFVTAHVQKNAVTLTAEWPRLERTPPRSTSRAGAAVIIFVVLSGLCIAGGGFQLARGDLSPTKEDA